MQLYYACNIIDRKRLKQLTCVAVIIGIFSYSTGVSMATCCVDSFCIIRSCISVFMNFVYLMFVS
uniref:Uncharacterized protein n=1 Tax=Arundo donax TaxID=35708 RepID=A0A0A8YEM7_ARUDO